MDKKQFQIHCLWLGVIYSGVIGDNSGAERGLGLIEKFTSEYFDNGDACSVEQPIM